MVLVQLKSLKYGQDEKGVVLTDTVLVQLKSLKYSGAVNQKPKEVSHAWDAILNVPHGTFDLSHRKCPTRWNL